MIKITEQQRVEILKKKLGLTTEQAERVQELMASKKQGNQVRKTMNKQSVSRKLTKIEKMCDKCNNKIYCRQAFDKGHVVIFDGKTKNCWMSSDPDVTLKELRGSKNDNRNK